MIVACMDDIDKSREGDTWHLMRRLVCVRAIGTKKARGAMFIKTSSTRENSSRMATR